jgi:hypothetical protein
MPIEERVIKIYIVRCDDCHKFVQSNEEAYHPNYAETLAEQAGWNHYPETSYSPAAWRCRQCADDFERRMSAEHYEGIDWDAEQFEDGDPSPEYWDNIERMKLVESERDARTE